MPQTAAPYPFRRSSLALLLVPLSQPYSGAAFLAIHKNAGRLPHLWVMNRHSAVRRKTSLFDHLVRLNFLTRRCKGDALGTLLARRQFVANLRLVRERLASMDDLCRSECRCASSVFPTRREILPHIFVHVGLISVPTPATILIVGNILKGIEVKAPET